jgi:peptidylprolyl isomerase
VKASPRIAAVLALCVALGVAGCGDDDDDDSASSSTTDTQQTANVDTSKKPKVEVPEGEPPAGLKIEDLKVGDGATARTGDSVSVQYVGVAYSTGKQFDASWDTPGQQPLPFTIGGGDVIAGWDQGVAGMKVGGRRELTIPPELAYGERGYLPDIAPNETLIFVIDLLDVG